MQELVQSHLQLKVFVLQHKVDVQHGGLGVFASSSQGAGSELPDQS